ncbi:unnamed protein product [Lactuca virosa]|uniref:DRBM domain-containing protein n=1 Tax=Lactuca virosa TaxID=75947 RepID=A0AAU9NPB3_9ASTR|nr:unnamed protein product [Lactuca virosa]
MPGPETVDPSSQPLATVKENTSSSRFFVIICTGGKWEWETGDEQPKYVRSFGNNFGVHFSRNINYADFLQLVKKKVGLSDISNITLAFKHPEMLYVMDMVDDDDICHLMNVLQSVTKTVNVYVVELERDVSKQSTKKEKISDEKKSSKKDQSNNQVEVGMQQQSYKRLLNEQVQRLRKQAPIYQTNNEGAEHQPKFRTTIWFDGVSYTSPNTFTHCKLAEEDSSKITLFAIIQKLKDEALNHLREDKGFCKAILAEYAVRMDIQRPTYQTTQSCSSVPVFHSSLVFFDDASFTGDNCLTKKKAEQSAAYAVILKYIESETGSILSEIIKSKFSHSVTKEIQVDQSDTNVVNIPVALNEAKSDEGTKTPHTEPLYTQETPTTPAVNPPVDITQTHVN